jgi:flagellin
MFRIQNNTPAVPALTQRLPQLRFDARQSTTRSDGATSAPSQMTIVGRPPVTERQKTELAAVRQTNRSIASAATVAQVTESGLTNAQIVLQRLYQLASRASNEELSAAERQILAEEARRLYQQLDEVAGSARINGIPLLNGAQQALTFQLGSGSAGSEVHLTLMDARPETLLPGLTSDAFAEPAFARTLTQVIQDAMQMVQERTDKVIAFQERLSTALEQLDDTTRRSADVVDAVRDTDNAQQVLALTRAMILSQSAQALVAQATLLSQNAMALIAP